MLGKGREQSLARRNEEWMSIVAGGGKLQRSCS